LLNRIVLEYSSTRAALTSDRGVTTCARELRVHPLQRRNIRKWAEEMEEVRQGIEKQAFHSPLPQFSLFKRCLFISFIDI